MFKQQVVVFSVLALGIADLAYIDFVVAPELVDPAGASTSSIRHANVAPREDGPEEKGVKERPLSVETPPAESREHARPDSKVAPPDKANMEALAPPAEDHDADADADADAAVARAKEKEPKPKPKPKRKHLRVAFPRTDQKDLTVASKRGLKAFAAQAIGNNKIVVEGHADARGGMRYNDELAASRARATADYLISQGIPADQLELRSVGERRPLVRARSPRAWAKNRRVEVRWVEQGDSSWDR